MPTNIIDRIRETPLTLPGTIVISLGINFGFYHVLGVFIRACGPMVPVAGLVAFVLFAVLNFGFLYFALGLAVDNVTIVDFVSQSDIGTMPPPANMVAQLQKGRETVDVPLLQLDEVDLNLDESPHTLIAGKTGTGKSNLTRALLPRIIADSPAQFAIIDTGGIDFGTHTAQTIEEIAQVIDSVYFICRGRGKDLAAMLQGSGTRIDMLRAARNMPRIILLWEEMEAGLTLLKNLPKPAYKRALAQLTYLATTARKTRVHLFGIVQKGKADLIPTEIRDNLDNLWLTRSTYAMATRQFDVPYRLNHLDVGVVYNNANECLVTVPLVETEPELDVLSLNKLQGMAKHLVEKYALKFDLGDETIEYAD